MKPLNMLRNLSYSSRQHSQPHTQQQERRTLHILCGNHTNTADHPNTLAAPKLARTARNRIDPLEQCHVSQLTQLRLDGGKSVVRLLPE